MFKERLQSTKSIIDDLHYLVMVKITKENEENRYRLIHNDCSYTIKH